MKASVIYEAISHMLALIALCDVMYETGIAAADTAIICVWQLLGLWF